MLKAFGDLIGVREGYMSHINTGYKNIGPKIARQMEEVLKLPRGWMDQQRDRSKANQKESSRQPSDEDRLQGLFELCRQMDAAKTQTTLLSLLEELLPYGATATCPKGHTRP
ncbi:hypothetical protein [Caballeronia novacaledonica]|uniref:Uncharacterized protein n=1 Tax=Caballeronia novacaledonica TaxID=1544861 RepID=A0AA37IJ07_9BURK|nr:hypothetical protein [Caballeronia novacaledonica]GJH30233.1 hypothetical protein CBA19CS42_36975 [Caballeronia novacaledonica]